LYQHKRIVGSGRNEKVRTYIVCHLSLPGPVIDLLQVWPKNHAAELGEKLLGARSEIGDEVDLESAELASYYRVSGSPGSSDDVRKLLTPSAIVKLIDFHNSIDGGTNSYIEIVSSAVALMVSGQIDPKNVDAIDDMIARCRPVVDWLAGATAPVAGGQSQP
jgi:hypothetical protein